ncbi:MAG: hypothetical protein PHW50_00350 [Patescibacteria group bacterium]|nr:hypothetical protein [Patescibacteria group bacterium]
MDSRLLQQLVKSIQDTVKCPVCGNFYPETNIRFKGNMNNFYLFNLTCGHCQSNVFAQVLVNGQGLKPQADIFVEPNPLKRQVQTPKQETKKSKIKADEVIAFAKFIDRNNRSFSTWIK